MLTAGVKGSLFRCWVSAVAGVKHPVQVTSQESARHTAVFVLPGEKKKKRVAFWPQRSKHWIILHCVATDPSCFASMHQIGLMLKLWMFEMTHSRSLAAKAFRNIWSGLYLLSSQVKLSTKCNKGSCLQVEQTLSVEITTWVVESCGRPTEFMEDSPNVTC